MISRLTAPLRNLIGFITSLDNIFLLLATLGMLIALAVIVFPLVLPQFAPFLEPRVDCVGLAPPTGSGARSMLAVTDDFQDLQLDLRLTDTTIEPGQPIEVEVIFSNDDRGPIILFMPEITDLVQGSTVGLGIRIIIEDLNNPGAQLIYGIPNRDYGTTFDDADIHLLRARNQCEQGYELSDANLPQGVYSIQAVYFNNRTGQLIQQPNRTVPPGVTTQGVWTATQQLLSPSIRFEVLPPATLTPIPQPAAQ